MMIYLEEVIKGFVSLIENDPTLVDIRNQYGFGGIIYKATTRKEIQNPGIYWTNVSDAFAENENPMRFQLTVFATSAAELIQMRNRVVLLLHSDTERELGNISSVWVMYVDSYDVNSENDDMHGTALDFMIIPVRGDR